RPWRHANPRRPGRKAKAALTAADCQVRTGALMVDKVKYTGREGNGMNRIALSAMGLLLAASSHAAWAQTAPPAAPPAQQPRNPFQSEPLGDGPWDIQTADAKLHVEVFAKGL